jgi:hypothetical protein
VRNSLLYLTRQELSDVEAAWVKILKPLAAQRRLGHASDRPADAVPVSLTLIAVPVARTEQGG